MLSGGDAAADFGEPVLGEVVDDALGPESLQPFVDGFWHLFGVDQTPPIGS